MRRALKKFHLFIISWKVKLFHVSKKNEKQCKEETAGKGQAELATEF